MSEFEPVSLFVRGDEETSDDDAWDDTILVEQYDRSVNQLKDKVAKMMGVSHGDSGAASGKASEKRSKHQKKKPINSWEVGSFCRAKYSVDDVFYEASILSINKEKKTCVVEYIGYGNQEEVHLDNLLHSEGRSARKSQEEQAVAENMNEWQSHIPDPSSLPPPPPPPPHIFEHLPGDDGEALSAMLMSWYMSGYHTGYYYGLKHGKSQQRSYHNGRHHGRWRKT
ncbi:survival motor neuron protein isoform X2 [Ischnura elegans]|uniref:survival motor neuron protein isoform X2 n=1 Tax=Ischnura elegans TaxID=197161 RepID=UPI001ED8B26D|nr:survival motor neuron protein isoform X2 [Ischnura elegans]